MTIRRSAKEAFIRKLFEWGLAIVLLPLLLLLILEGGLRLSGYGQDTQPFRCIQEGPRKLYQPNPKFLVQFCGSALSSLNWGEENPCIIMPKPDRAFRIFIFGGSVAFGYPEQQFGASRILQLNLMRAFPDIQFEIVNLAYPAMNSNVMRPVLEASLDLAPDALILCMGNNEYIGPFGLQDSRGDHTKAMPVRAIRAQLWMRRFRVYQGLLSLFHPFANANASSEFIPPPSPEAARSVRHNFQQNLDAMIQAAKEAGSPVILTTLAANLRDWPPEKARPEALRENPAMAALLADAEKAVVAGAPEKALKGLAKLFEESPFAAQAHYLAAQSYESLARFEAAKSQYLEALEKDALVWVRCRHDIDQVIRAAASAFKTPNLRLADARHRIEAASPHGIPGADLFYDCCHPTFKGNFLMAESIFAELASLPSLKNSTAKGSALSVEDCAFYLGFSAAKEAASRIDLIAEWEKAGRPIPLVYQRRRDECLAQARAERPDQVLCGLQEGISVIGPDFFRYCSLLLELEATGDKAAALAAAQAMRRDFPFQPKSGYFYGKSLLDAGALAEARVTLRASCRLLQNDPDCIAITAEAALEAGALEEANAILKDALRRLPHAASLWEKAGDCALKKKDYAEAQRYYACAIERDPLRYSAHLGLAKSALESSAGEKLADKLNARMEQGEDVASAQLGLGVLAETEGNHAKAVEHYFYVYHHTPSLSFLQTTLQALLEDLTRSALEKHAPEQALHWLKQWRKLDEKNAVAQALQSEARLAIDGDYKQADLGAAYMKALAAAPNNHALYSHIEALLLEKNDLTALIRFWERAIHEQPANALVYHFSGKALALAENYPAAIRALEKADSLQSGVLNTSALLSNVTTEYALSLYEEGNTAEAACFTSKALSFPEASSNLTALWLNGILHPDSKEICQRGIEALRKALPTHAEDTVLYERFSQLFLKQEKTPALIKEWEKQLARFPLLPLAHYHLGKAQEANGSSEEAIKSYKAALGLDPSAILTQRALNSAMQEEAEKAIKNGAFNGALHCCEEAEKYGFANSAWRRIKSTALLGLDDPQNALAVLLAGIEEAPEERAAFRALEDFFTQQRDMAGLAATCRDLITQQAGNPHPHYFLGQALLSLNDERGAWAAFDAALRLAPEDTEAQQALTGLAFAEIERLLLHGDAATAKETLAALPPCAQEEALFPILALLAGGDPAGDADWEAQRARIEAAIVKSPEKYLYYEALLKLYRQRHREDALCDYLLRLTADLPENALAMSYLAQAQEAAGENEAALEAYLNAVSLDPKAPKAQEGLQQLVPVTLDRMLNEGRPAEVLRYAERLAPLAFLKALVLKRSARAHTALKEEAASLKAWRDLIEVTPWDYEAYDALAALYLAREDLAGLEETWREMAEAHPDRLLAQYSLGLVYEREGKLEEARNAYQSAEKLDPDAEGTREALRRIQKKLADAQ